VDKIQLAEVGGGGGYEFVSLGLWEIGFVVTQPPSLCVSVSALVNVHFNIYCGLFSMIYHNNPISLSV
jgi:hypothetical protein